MFCSEGDQERKQIRVDCPRVEAVVALLVEKLGFAVTLGERCDARVLELDSIESVAKLGIPIPTVVIAHRRLRTTEIDLLKERGARAVIDQEATIFDLGIALSEILFDTRAAQRRYARRWGGAELQIRVIGSRVGEGLSAPISARVLSLARLGVLVSTSEILTPGTRVELGMDVSGRVVSTQGRVAFVGEADGRESVAIEFVLDQMGEVDALKRVASPLMGSSLC